MYLRLDIDRGAGTLLAEQVQGQIKQLICDGVLPPGSRLPSSRRLASDLDVSRSVVVEAYQQLIAEGWLSSMSRSGTRVAAHLDSDSLATVPARREPVEEPIHEVRWDLQPGSADVRSFPRREWSACLAKVLRHASHVDLDYPSLAGAPVMRTELAGYLGRVRSVRATPNEVMVTVGFAQGLSLLCLMLQRRGINEIGIEDPGHPGQRTFLENIGIRTIPIPVDAYGIDVDALARSGARSVLTTPAHQYPTGVVLSPNRRRMLVEWARRVDGVIIEDDYDGEFWYDNSVRPASLQCEAPERVVYGGTASKILAPGLRLGWLVAPPEMFKELQRVRGLYDLGSGTIDQLAYTEFIRSGRLDRHLRRTREAYRRRSNLVLDSLVRNESGSPMPRIELTGVAAGLHAHLSFPPELDEAAFVRKARSRRVLVRGASQFSLARHDARPGIVVGYAKQSDAWLVEALEELRGVALDLTRTSCSGRC